MGYFHLDDGLLNRIWCAGVYMGQLCHIYANESRANPPTITSYGRFNNATIIGLSADGEAYVDGAKRDRTPWPGDFDVSTLPKLVALNRDNLDSVGNSITALYKLQSKGMSSYAGSLIGECIVAANPTSDTYHLWTLIAMTDHTALSGNSTIMKSLWNQIVLGMTTRLDKVNASDSLLNMTGSYDLGCTGQGDKNIAANVLLYRALVTCAEIAENLRLKALERLGWLVSRQYGHDAAPTGRQRARCSIQRHAVARTGGADLQGCDLELEQVRLGGARGVRDDLAVRDELRDQRALHRAAGECHGCDGHLAPLVGVHAHALQQLDADRRILRDGELEYPFYGIGFGAYISHAYAWSTGSAASLTLQVNGLASVSDAGKIWRFQPHAAGSGVNSVEIGCTLATGALSVEWTAVTNSSKFSRAALTTPDGTMGSISMPTFGISLSKLQTSINGDTIWTRNQTRSTKFGTVTTTQNFATFANTSGCGVYHILAEQL